jgi:hypothetical protein
LVGQAQQANHVDEIGAASTEPLREIRRGDVQVVEQPAMVLAS